jgi:hypothetical protein
LYLSSSAVPSILINEAPQLLIKRAVIFQPLHYHAFHAVLLSLSLSSRENPPPLIKILGHIIQIRTFMFTPTVHA